MRPHEVGEGKTLFGRKGGRRGGGAGVGSLLERERTLTLTADLALEAVAHRGVVRLAAAADRLEAPADLLLDADVGLRAVEVGLCAHAHHRDGRARAAGGDGVQAARRGEEQGECEPADHCGQ